jgi:hypothetical protein
MGEPAKPQMRMSTRNEIRLEEASGTRPGEVTVKAIDDGAERPTVLQQMWTQSYTIEP